MSPHPFPLAAVPLAPNPAWRSYSGGRVLRAFRGLDDSPDDHFPEDWLASTVRARNGSNSQGPEEGLSRVGNGAERTTLAEALQTDPEFWFGRREAGRSSTGVLWKLLDSSVRLQFQAHPDAAFARSHLNSNAGKTECWCMLSTREQACVYLGFQRPPSREAWARMIREQRIDEMLACFDPIPVKPGECYVVPAGTPHAIGAGIFMMELMEPTDWVVRCETVNTGVTLLPEACFMGLGLERCLDIFDYRPYSVERVRQVFQQTPSAIRTTSGFTEEDLIGPAWHHFFRLRRLRGTGNATWAGGELQLLIALKGHGELSAGGAVREAATGQTWLLPGAAGEWSWHSGSPEWECLLALLPLKDPSSSR
jgi:mannose-6-phosphate isomerase